MRSIDFTIESFPQLEGLEGPHDDELALMEDDIDYDPFVAMASIRHASHIVLPVGRNESNIPLARSRGDYLHGSETYALPKINPADRVAGLGGFAVNVLLENTESSGYNWQERASCRGVDLDIFFPERGANALAAKAVCDNCIVREDCLEFAVQNNEKFGIWGGLSERERRRIRRQRRLDDI
ncbi:MAG: WhiB family transcriptional regulator [bacterium]|nr:WhiB family transcriptional regulator [bacterium]